MRASTLYEYFANKDEIVWAIFNRIAADDARSIEQCVNAATTGLAKIAALLQYMTGQLSANTAQIRFMAQFDAMYARDWPVERLLMLEGQLSEQGFRIFGALVRQGIADGSLRPDLDPDLTLHAVLNGVLGGQRRLASLGAKVEAEYGQPIQRMFEEMVRITLFGLSAQEHPRVSLRAPATRRSKRKGTP